MILPFASFSVISMPRVSGDGHSLLAGTFAFICCLDYLYIYMALQRHLDINAKQPWHRRYANALPPTTSGLLPIAQRLVLVSAHTCFLPIRILLLFYWFVEVTVVAVESCFGGWAGIGNVKKTRTWSYPRCERNY